jgi:GT2 family glycosyltransferase
MIDISCAIVLFRNDPAELRNTVESFLRSTKENIKLYLIDNSEEDSLRYEFESSRIEYIFTGVNNGFGAAHNIVIDRLKGKSKYHLILNPDVSFGPEVLGALYKFMEHNEDVGLVMPKVLYRNGDIQYLCKKLPSPIDLIFRRMMPGPAKRLFKSMLESYELKFKDYDAVMEVPNLSGCFMFTRTSVLEKTGGFDEQYFLYLEDTDLSRRINSISRTVYYPRVNIIHSYAKGSYKNYRLLRYHIRSSIKYFNKWGWFLDRSRSAINRALTANSTQHPSQLNIPA